MNNMLTMMVIVSFLIVSCNINDKKNSLTNIDKWVGKEITIPSDSLNIKIKNVATLNTDIFKPDNIKFIVSINGECGTCIYKLKAVETFANEVFSLYSNISLLVYINSKTTDFSNFEIFNNSEINFQYPLLYDYENRYLTENQIPSNEFYHILLCDSNNKILMIGDFTENTDLKELYIKQINSHANPLIFDYPTRPPIEKTLRKSP